MLKSTDAACEMYKANFFPEFKVDWRTYPSHLGHMESAGCFRCHDGLHVADDGRRITSDCNTCHTFLYRQDDDKNMIREQKFDHPSKINELMGRRLGPHEEDALHRLPRRRPWRPGLGRKPQPATHAAPATPAAAG